MNNKLILIPNNYNDLSKLRNVGISTFLFPIAKYSIGYNSFSIEEINEIKDTKYLLINRILNTKEIKELISDIKLYKNIQGLFFEDLGVYEVFKSEKYELINFQTHFGTNYHSINYMLNLGMDSYVVANDLTFEEINEITENVKKPIIIFIFGQNEVMYSRRKLLNNFQEYYQIKATGNTIKEKVSKVEFDIKDNEYGTYLFDHHYYNGSDLLKTDNNNIRQYLINAQNINIDKIIMIIKLICHNKTKDIKLIDPNINEGFLYKETIYRVKGEDK